MAKKNDPISNWANEAQKRENKERAKKETKPDLNMLPESEHIHKNLHDIRTMYCNDGEVTLYGRDEYGKEFTLTMCLYEAINWLDVDYFKKKLIKHIKNK